jgi:cytochrome o ubiquinol oxidase operon protein cyoD
MPASAPNSPTDRRPYLVGLLLALVLTTIPFAVVYFQLLPMTAMVGVIVVAAVAQIGVHLRCFLHIDFRRTPNENLAALAFTVFLMVVMVGGSLWIMFNLRGRMGP